MIGGAALRGEGGFDIGMGDMLVAGSIQIQRLGSAVRRLDGGGACLLVHGDHLAAPTIDPARLEVVAGEPRSEEHTSELQSLLRISYAVFCLKKKKKHTKYSKKTTNTQT